MKSLLILLVADLALSACARAASLSPTIQPGALQVLGGQRIEVITYTVRADETIFGIAAKFHLHAETILWSNEGTLANDPSRIRPGVVLNILPVNGVYYQWKLRDDLLKVAQRYNVKPEDILNWPGNHLNPQNPRIQPGTMLIVPNGHPTLYTLPVGDGTIPTPVSPLVESFVWQTDGLFGYRMLRPANWDSTKPFDGRDFRIPGFQNKADRIMLRVINLQAYYKSGISATGTIAQLALFEKDSSLEGWTKGIEQMWKNDGLEFTLLRSLPQAKIYSVKTPSYSNIQLVAYAVDENQPLAMELTAAGVYADMKRLQKDGILDDFATMVASAQAIPQDPQNVDPPLATQ